MLLSEGRASPRTWPGSISPHNRPVDFMYSSYYVTSLWYNDVFTTPGSACRKTYTTGPSGGESCRGLEGWSGQEKGLPWIKTPIDGPNLHVPNRCPRQQPTWSMPLQHHSCKFGNPHRHVYESRIVLFCREAGVKWLSGPVQQSSKWSPHRGARQVPPQGTQGVHVRRKAVYISGMYGLACIGVKYELGVPLCSVIRAYVRTTPHILVEWENKWAIPYQITTHM